MRKSTLVDKIRWTIQGILQKLLGYNHYLFLLSLLKIYIIKLYKREKDFNYFLNLLKESDQVLDIGANLGIMTTLISQRVKKGKVFAFEPMPFNFTNIQRLTRWFKCTNVECFNMALGEKDETMEMITPTIGLTKMSGLSYVAEKNTRISYSDKVDTYQVQASRLENLKIFQKVHIDYIKIDVENYEKFVFRGGLEFLRKNKPVILCEIWNAKSRKEDLSLLAGMGYTMKVLEDNTLVDFDAHKHPEHLNYFFIPDKEK
ncbi:MAG: FkbM family methyltransferase [bacterium]